MEINHWVLVVLLLSNGLVLVPTYRRLPKDVFSIYYLLIGISTFVYSGFGMCYENIGAKYLVKYIVFYTVYLLTLYFCRIQQAKKNKASSGYCVEDKSKYILRANLLHENTVSYDCSDQSMPATTFSSGTVSILALVFYFTYLIFLMIPENRLYMIYSPPSPTVIGGYSRIALANNNVLLDVSTTVRSACLPFFMLTLKRNFDNKKFLALFVLIATWVYLQYLADCYIGRSELMVFIIFALVIYANRKNGSFFISNKLMVLILMLATAAVPLLVSYQYLRQGQVADTTSYKKAFSTLASIEFMFPMYYNKLSQIAPLVSPIKYILWLILLPIPSVLLPQKGAITLQINRIFSSQILGIAYGQIGYTGLVPSIFGEAVLLFGEYFYFIHGIILGLLIYSLYKMLHNFPELKVLNLYFAVNAITIARGGSQGFLGTAINSVFLYILISLIVKAIKRKHSGHLQ